jgi:hypothetical protein
MLTRTALFELVSLHQYDAHLIAPIAAAFESICNNAETQLWSAHSFPSDQCCCARKSFAMLCMAPFASGYALVVICLLWHRGAYENDASMRMHTLHH